jgi:hypothetical protein
MVTMVACGSIGVASDDPPYQFAAPREDLEPSPTDDGVNTEFVDPRSQFVTSDDKLVQIARAVPGFGGYYRDRDTGQLVIWLVDPDLLELAELGIIDKMGPDVIRAAGARIRVAQYGFDELKAWLEILEQTAWSTPGTVSTGVADELNRVRITLSGEAGKLPILKEMEANDIPVDAVVIKIVGQVKATPPPIVRDSAGTGSTRIDDAWSSDQSLISSVTVNSGLRLTLETRSRVQVGGIARIRLLVEPAEGEVLEDLEWGGSPFNAFVATGGDKVWNWHQGRADAAILNGGDIRRDRPLSFEVEWPTTDADGFPVGPGSYIVWGSFRARVQVLADQEGQLIEEVRSVALELAPLTIVVTAADGPESGTPRPEGTYVVASSSELVTDDLRLTLVAPPQAVAGQPVNLRLMMESLLTHSSDRDLALRGKSSDLDIVVRRNGQEIWRASEEGADRADIKRTTKFAKFLTHQEMWTTENSVGDPLSPGTYTATGYLRIVVDRNTEAEKEIVLETPPLDIEVVSGG